MTNNNWNNWSKMNKYQNVYNKIMSNLYNVRQLNKSTLFLKSLSEVSDESNDLEKKRIFYTANDIIELLSDDDIFSVTIKDCENEKYNSVSILYVDEKQTEDGPIRVTKIIPDNFYTMLATTQKDEISKIKQYCDQNDIIFDSHSYKMLSCIKINPNYEDIINYDVKNNHIKAISVEGYGLVLIYVSMATSAISYTIGVINSNIGRISESSHDSAEWLNDIVTIPNRYYNKVFEMFPDIKAEYLKKLHLIECNCKSEIKKYENIINSIRNTKGYTITTEDELYMELLDNTDEEE